VVVAKRDLGMAQVPLSFVDLKDGRFIIYAVLNVSIYTWNERTGSMDLHIVIPQPKDKQNVFSNPGSFVICQIE
jgi:hypothetical protein